MRSLELTLPTPAENLALDEALLDWAEVEDAAWEFLRLWESPQTIVVVGRSSRVREEVNEAACAARRIPILRRSSGGAAVITGPGCLMYAVVLSLQLRPELHDIRRAHAFVLGRLTDALRARIPNVAPAGTSDLVLDAGCSMLDDRYRASTLEPPRSEYRAPSIDAYKFSGNSLRVKRTHLLYHGTLLYAFDLSLVTACLRMPPRQPAYRRSRHHDDFLMNLPLDRDEVIRAVQEAWPTEERVVAWPEARVVELVRERFGQKSWNLQFGCDQDAT